ncbi:TonB-dependent receptor [Aurantivibrio plasticivorans]
MLMSVARCTGVIILVTPAFFSAGHTWAQGSSYSDNEMEEILVTGRQQNLVGEASSASEGVVSQAELEIRPLLRTGEVLETVPGLVATQHSGPGKANQYFLRGFNLDHGTDFATVIDKMPVNMRTHGHGQGYTDLNFIIPELVGEIVYQKGTYYPGVGDFSGTGTARMASTNSLGGHQMKVGSDFGRENWNRFLAWGQTETGDYSQFIYGVEYETTDGHWDDIESDLQKKNIWLKQQWRQGDSDFALTFMAYDNSWNSADQIPERAVDLGIITEYGSLNTTSGGESSRYSISGNWSRQTKNTRLDASVYTVAYELDLYADFTYFLDNPILGDQHNQVDDRTIYGWDVAWSHFSKVAGLDMANTFGTQMRYDDIAKVGIYRTEAQQRYDVFRIDSVDEWSTGLYWENEINWTEKFRTVVGVRYDYYDFEVNPIEAGDSASLAVNGGNASDDIVTSSLSLMYAFNDEVEAYASIGQGFHSNDARGTTIQVDPTNASVQVEKVDPLVDTLGYEFGLRAFFTDKLNASIALWALDIDSELVFIGDSGATEDTGVGSERRGVEVTGYYYLNEAWTFDMEYSYSDAAFVESVDGSTDIPGALEHVISAGVNTKWSDSFYTNIRLRYFDEYPLDGGRTADASSIVNLRLNYDITSQLSLSLDVLNLFNSEDKDIQYVYESQINDSRSGYVEASPVEDLHFHIFEPRAYHLNLSYRF